MPRLLPRPSEGREPATPSVRNPNEKPHPRRLESLAARAASRYRKPMEPEFHGATFQMRKLRSPWREDGAKPESVVKIKPDCLGIRMKLPNGGHVVMPLGRLTSNPST